MDTYNYKGIISTFESVAYKIIDAKLFYGEEEETRIIDNMKGDWGDIYPMSIITKETFTLPKIVKLRWITLVDVKCYEITAELDTERLEKMWAEQEKQFPESPFKYIVVGIAPYGGIAIWLRSNVNSVFFQQLKADEVPFDDFESPVYSEMKGSDEVMNSMFPKNELESIMKQYNYRYKALEEYFDGKQWKLYANDDERYEDIDIECVEDKRVDGTFDFTDSDTLFKYHTTGMPKRITVRWTEDGAKYFAHFWLDSYYVAWFFESFHKMFPEMPVDLLIRIDTRANLYDVVMTAEDLVPRSFVGTQYIVFRDNVEINRSKHFNKEDGEWDWE